MTVRSQALAIGLALFSSTSAVRAADDTIPRWDIGEICAVSDLGAHCPTIESQNRRAVFNRWQTLPATDRQACEQKLSAPGRQSYKALLSCLEERQLKALDEIPHSDLSRANES